MTEFGTDLVDRLGRRRPGGFHTLRHRSVVEERQLWRRLAEVSRADPDETHATSNGDLGKCIVEEMNHRLRARDRK